ncbi:MAG: hypothetical protein SD837_10520 [Candidatus Electrothrix scaldis]|nr:MAG: hypothetical protein SD837_10520 [Candidatus Electrothrix sp. GW3-3]
MEHYIRYFINRENRIESINDVWRSFAAKNGGEKLMNEMVLYRDISKFIACDRCQELYYMLLESIRASKKAIGFSFRCDSPETRRYMKMEMVPLEQGKVQFTSYLEREEEREPVALLEIFAERSVEIITICSWCKRIKAENGSWLDAEEAVEKMALFHKERLPKLSHGVCPVCYELLIKKIS